ncbi:MAG: hypothetical protein V4671_04650 [Armatimonadota bacterium]
MSSSSTSAPLRQSDAESLEFRKLLARMDAINRTIVAALKEAKIVVDAALTLAGYQRHKRGNWRKRRTPMHVEMVDAAKAELAARKFTVPEDSRERARIIYDALNNKKGADEAAAVACIRKHPTDYGLGFWNTTEAVVTMVVGDKKPVLQEILRQEANQHKDALLGESPTQLERILVDRIVACGLQVGALEREYDAALSKAGGMYISQSESFGKKIERAHKNHLMAIKTLAQVRKLQLPTIAMAMPGSTQINIGEKQVNMAGSVDGQTNLPAD